MLSLTKTGYEESRIIKALHNSREISFKYNLLNKNEVKIGELTANADSNNITYNSRAEIKRIGRFSFRESEMNDVNWLNDKVQPVFRLNIDGKLVEWALGIFIMSSPTRVCESGVIWRDVEAYDSTLILKEDLFEERYFIDKDKNYIDEIKEILNSAGIWKINIKNSDLTVNAAKEFEGGTSKLDAINALLSEINYESIQVDPYGFFKSSPYILPSEKEIEYTYAVDKTSIIHDGMIDELDLFKVPNKWITYTNNPDIETLTSIYVNSSPASSTSTYSRGRTIVDKAPVDDIADQKTLDAYTLRRAQESSMVVRKLIFDTALMPHHTHKDVLYVKNGDLSLANKYIETQWKMSLRIGGKMRHECERVVII